MQEVAKRVNEVSGIKESDTGLAHPSRWDLVSDRQAMQEEQPLQVAHLNRLGSAGVQPCALDDVVCRLFSISTVGSLLTVIFLNWAFVGCALYKNHQPQH